MKRFVVAALAAGLVGVVPGSATADVSPLGPVCAFRMLAFEDGTATAEMDAGPMVLLDFMIAGNPASGSVTCTLQVGGATHADADEVALTSPTTTGVAVLRPTTFTFAHDPADVLFVCTSVLAEGYGPRYWDPEERVWTADAGASCLDPAAPPDNPFAPPWGDPCNFVIVDEYYHSERFWAESFGGPVFVGDATATMTCTWQTGWDTTYAGHDAVVRTSPAMYGVVVLPPDGIAIDPDEGISLCSEVSLDDGRTFYHDDVTGEWTQDRDVECWTPFGGPPPSEIPNLFRELTDEAAEPTDPTLCPMLASSPVLRDPNGPLWIAPDGDVWAGGVLLWLC